MDTYAGYDYGSTYYDSSVAGGLMGALFGVLMVFIVVCLIIGIIGIVGQWKVFKKANKPGWAALIPIYNLYIMCQVVGINPWWILIVILSPILNIIPILGSLAVAAISIYFSILMVVSLAHSFGKDTGWAVGLYLLNPFFMLALGVGQSKYLGPKPMKDILFDDLLNKNNNTNTNSNSTSSNLNNNPSMNNNTNNDSMNNDINTQTIVNTNAVVDNSTPDNTSISTNNSTSIESLNDNSTKYCSSCGTKVSKDDKFCPNCGTKL